MAPNLELLFLKNFNGTIIFSVQFLFHLHVISRRGDVKTQAYRLDIFPAIKGLWICPNITGFSEIPLKF